MIMWLLNQKDSRPEETNVDAMINDPLPQDHDLFAEQVDIDTQAMLTNRPARSVLMTNRPVQLRLLINRQPQ